MHAYEYANDTMDLLDHEDGAGSPSSLANGAANMLTGGPHRPMLSVLLSLGVSALPIPRATSFTHPLTSRAHGRRRQAHRMPKGSGESRSASVSVSARSSMSLSDDGLQSPTPPYPYPYPSSPYTSLFVAPPPPKAVKRIVVSRSKKLTTSSSFYLPILFLLTLFVATLFPIALSLYSLPLRSFYYHGTSSSLPVSSISGNFNASSNLNAKTFNIPPRTLADVSALAASLRAYAASSEHAKFHVLLVLSMTAIWKHAWSIPGSVVLNVIAGALYTSSVTLPGPGPKTGATGAGIGGGIAMATLHMTLLTTLGSIAASMLSMPLAPLVRTFFPRALDVTRTALEGSPAAPSSSFNEKTGVIPTTNGRSQEEDGTPTWVRLVVMRLVGVVPWSGINVACGVCGVSYFDCFVGTFIGTLPWTAVTCQVCAPSPRFVILILLTMNDGVQCSMFGVHVRVRLQIGDIIQTVSAASGSGAKGQTLGSVLASPTNIAKLVLLSALSLGPVLYRDKLRSVLSGSGKSGGAAGAVDMREGGTTLPSMTTPKPGGTSAGGADDEHLLPLAYHHHHLQHKSSKDLTTSLPQRQMSASSATTSSTTEIPSSPSSPPSEASSTVGDEVELALGLGEVVAEPEEITFERGEEDEDDAKEGRKTDSVNSSTRWSFGWTMWRGEKDMSRAASLEEDGLRRMRERQH